MLTLCLQEAPKTKADQQDGFAGRSMPGTSGRKYTEEGFPIYTEEELGLNNKGGDGPDCPFDVSSSVFSCCFVSKTLQCDCCH